jgi:hypothetical protein
MYAIADLDWERIENDPYWQWIIEQVDISDSKQKEAALFQYLTDHVLREQLFATRPVFGTNGPSDLYVTNLEVVRNEQPANPTDRRTESAAVSGEDPTRLPFKG